MPSQRRVRVLVVEDSATVRARIVGALRADDGIDVIAEASDGRSAIDLCTELRPDVVTMDLMLPVITGLAATEHLMQHCPTPILIISAASNRGDFVDTLAALAAGAVEVLEKPDASQPGGGEEWDRHLVATVRLVARIRVITHLHRGPRQGGTPAVEHLERQGRSERPGWYSVLALGASTGGPTAVCTVLRGLPRSFSLPVLLVVHVSESFGSAFAEWLEDVTGRTVRLATPGESLSSAAGEVILAPPGRHLAVHGGALVLTRDPERHSCRPSVDVLFESLAQECGSRVAACLLTGMGRDGAAGLLEVHRAGGVTIAQDEATSAVYGMPGEAARLGAAQHVLPIDQIGPALAKLTGFAVESK
jgi:two-component system, chemotaxis family, protein-glutamate methylesterase/glutaminase